MTEETRLERQVTMLTQRVAALEAYVVELRVGTRHAHEMLEATHTHLTNVELALKEEILARERFDKAIEAWTGQVEIDGTKHLLECIKRKDKTQACTCGAQPVGSFAAAEENDGDDDGH